MSCSKCKNSIDSMIPYKSKVEHQSGAITREYKCMSCGAIWQCTTWPAIERLKGDPIDSPVSVEWKELY